MKLFFPGFAYCLAFSTVVSSNTGHDLLPIAIIILTKLVNPIVFECRTRAEPNRSFVFHSTILRKSRWFRHSTDRKKTP